MFRIMGLMACSGLVAASMWLANRSYAQEFTPTVRPAGGSSATSDVARRRVLDTLAQAEQAWRTGKTDEAIRLGLAADRLAREKQVSFRPGEQSPGAFLARVQAGRDAGANAPVTPEATPPQTAGMQPQQAAPASGDHHARVQQLLQAADADVRAGRLDQAMAKAREAEQAIAEHRITLEYFDIRPEHIVSLVRRQDPQAAAAQPAIQQVAHEVETNSGVPADPARAKQQVVELLSLARQAMEQGHYNEARDLALEARKYESHVAFSVFDDRPDLILSEVERLTRSQIHPGASPTQTASTDARREQAVALVQEAQQRLQQGDVEGARQLAHEAQQLGATYGVVDPRPELVLQDIRSRGANASFAAADGNGWGGVTPAGGAASATGDAKSQANALVREARVALQNGQLDLAQQRAQEAMQYEVAFGLLEDSPERILNDAARLSQSAGGGSQASLAAAADTDARRVQGEQMLQQARWAIQEGNLDAARQLAMQADSLGVAYDRSADRPDLVLADIEHKTAQMSGLAYGANNARGGMDLTTRESFGAGEGRRDSMVLPAGASAEELFTLGVTALRRGDRGAARQAFLTAYQSGEKLDPTRQQQLQDYLSDLRPTSDIQQASNETLGGPAVGPLNVATERREIRADKLRTEVLDAIYRAEKMRDKQPEQALELLVQTSSNVNSSEIDEQQKARLLASLESTSSSIEAYINQRKPLIELERRNSEVRNLIKVEREQALRIDQEIANLTEQYNQLMEQQRFSEAHHVAKQARELAPQNPVVVQMFYQSMFAGRDADNDKLREGKERTFYETLRDVENGLVHNIRDDSPLEFGENWKDIIARREAQPTDAQERTDEELRVREALEKPVSLHFQDEPIASIMEHISSTHLINVTVDSAGLLETGVQASTPVTINVDGIRLKSALNLILGPLDLSYTIENEVLMITSRLRQQGELKAVVYPVADLVVPIPVEAPISQFQPGSGFGVPNGSNLNGPMAGAIPNGGGFGQVPDPLASQLGLPGLPTGSEDKTSGGAANYDFQSLTELITATVEPGSWDEFGGQASLTHHASTLSLVIRQTQRVHQEISDLLAQLRRLQDLQVSIEVRFITVSDRFFERIGIDFDFNVNDSVGGPNLNDDFTPIPRFGTTDPNFGLTGGGTQGQGQQGQGQGQAQQGGGGLPPFGAPATINIQPRDSWPGRTIVGLIDEGTFSPDLDIPFRQGSFELGVPDFGGFTDSAGISFGMAILSDIEAFLFVNAAQGDERSNVMFAPKLTLFNGQLGTIVSALIRPFVVSVIPVATGLVVGFQPVIQTIPDGAVLTVRAVISADRRYVRLSVSPQFTNITDVFTFSFFGGVPNIGGQQQGAGGAIGAQQQGGQQQGQQGQQGQQQQQQGSAVGAITVQQPVTDVVTVSTVVSVPDGGTVLLGGVKRLREGRNMSGVPILNKIPYVSRLFKNTGVGRETDSLMLMVTPRIIIAEEEEELLGIPSL